MPNMFTVFELPAFELGSKGRLAAQRTDCGLPPPGRRLLLSGDSSDGANTENETQSSPKYTLQCLRESLYQHQHLADPTGHGRTASKVINTLQFLPVDLQAQVRHLGGLRALAKKYPREFSARLNNGETEEWNVRYRSLEEGTRRYEELAWLDLEAAKDIVLGALLNAPRQAGKAEGSVSVGGLVKLLPNQFTTHLKELGGTAVLCKEYPQVFKQLPATSAENWENTEVLGAERIQADLYDYFDKYQSEYPELRPRDNVSVGK